LTQKNVAPIGQKKNLPPTQKKNCHAHSPKKFATPTLTPKAAHKLKKIVNMQTSKNRKYDGVSETIKDRELGNYQRWRIKFRFRSLATAQVCYEKQRKFVTEVSRPQAA